MAVALPPPSVSSTPASFIVVIVGGAIIVGASNTTMQSVVLIAIDECSCFSREICHVKSNMGDPMIRPKNCEATFLAQKQ